MLARWMAMGVGLLVVSSFAGCSGDGDAPQGADADAPPGAATIGPEGGTVLGADGARVLVPAGAASAPVTVRIAKDATDMPALPAWLTPVGAVWQLTPHGGGFDAPVGVRLPVPARALAGDEVLRIAKVSPGGTWELLTPEASDRDLVVNVRSFSYFVPVVEKYDQPIGRLPPFALGVTRLSCAGGPCGAVDPDSAEVLMDLTANDGVFPRGCVAPRLAVSVSGAGDWLAPAPTATAIDPMTQDIVGGRPTYRFRFQARTPLVTIAGGRLAVDGSINVALRCAGPPASDTPLLSAALAFPSKSGGVPGFRFGVGLSGPTCNGGSCIDVTGVQAVRTTATVGAGGYLPSACGTGTPSLVFRRPDGGVLAAEPVFASPQVGYAVTRGQTTTVAFSVAPPLDAGDYPIDVRLLCNGNFYAAHGFTLRFATPQAAVAPSVGTAPRPVSVLAGQTASFTVTAAGFPVPTLQWQTRAGDLDAWTDLAGATGATHTTAATTLADNGRQFRVVLANALGSVASSAATLSVDGDTVAPAVRTQPASLGVVTGSDAVFAVHASGTGPLNYQWRLDGVPIVGANGALLKLSATVDAQAGRYSVEISNAAGRVVSDEAVLTVSPSVVPAVAPTIVTPPAAVTVNAGNTATFAVGVGGTAPFGYQWLKDGQPIAGATAAFHSLAAADVASAGAYAVRVSNAAGTVTSAAATLNVIDGPAPVAVAIATQPSPQVQLPGGSATFAVAASGSGPIAYQWLKDGAPIAGATGAVLTLVGVTGSDVAAYAVVVGNALGSVTSQAAALTVVGAPAITGQPVAAAADEGASASFAVAATGQALRYQWTRNGEAIPGADQPGHTTPALAAADDGAVYRVVVYNGAGLAVSQGVVLTVRAAPAATADDKIAAGLNHTCAIDRRGALFCWGNGANGEIGDGASTYRDVPTVVAVPGTVKAVAAGSWSTCAIDADDALWCWGSLADTVPTRLSASGVRVRSVSLGSYHGCYVDGRGEVHCWGRNTFGQRGDAAAGEWPNAVQRADGGVLGNAVAVAVGVNHSCARLADGSTWCWGADVAFGAHPLAQRVMRRLPDGSRVDFTAAGRLVAGSYHTCAVESGSGQPMCWGSNNAGQLGDGTTISRDDAMPAGLSGALGLAAGSGHTCAIRASDMYCWGTAFMGNGAERQTLLVPDAAGRVGAYTNSPDAVAAAVAGERHTCVLRRSGDVQCWGWNNAGQAGIGSVSDTVNVLTPASTAAGAVFWRP